MSDFISGGLGAPQIPTPDVPPPNYTDTARAYLQEFLGNHWWTEIIAAVANGLVSCLITIITWMTRLADDVVIALAQLAIAAQGQNSPEFLQLEATVLTLIFGIEVDATTLLQQAGDKGLNPTMTTVGADFLGLLTTLFTTTTPVPSLGGNASIEGGGPGNVLGQHLPAGAGLPAAARLIGFRIASELRAENAGLVMELASFGFLKPFADFIETMQTAVPMSRLINRAMAPFIKILVADPMTGELNAQYRPTPLAVSEAVRAYTRGLIDAGDLSSVMARAGYSDDVQQILIHENQAHPVLGDVEVAYRAGLLKDDTDLLSWTNLGYTKTDAQTLQQLAKVKATNSYVSQFVSEVLALAKDNFIDIDVINKLIADLPIFDEEKDWIRKLYGLYQDTHRKRLSLSQMETALEEAVIDQNQFAAWATAEAYDPQSQQILGYLEALKLKDEQDKAAAAAAAAKSKADAAAATAATKAAQQVALAGGPGGVAGTLSDWLKAYNQGIISDDDYLAFLKTYGYAGKYLDIVFTEAQNSRAAALAANVKAQQIIAAEGTTPLTLAQIEAAYEAQLIDDAELTNRLQAIGYAGANLQILIEYEQAQLATKKAKAAAGAGAGAAAPKPKLTQADGLAALLAGVLTRDQYAELLLALGFSADEANVELAIADQKLAAQLAAATAAAAAKAAAPTAGLTLAQLKAFVLAGTATRDQYVAFLVQKGYSADDQALLLADLDTAIAKQNAANQTPTPTPATGPVKTLSPSDEENAFVQGLITKDQYTAYLTNAGYSADDIALLLSLSASKKAAAAAVVATSPAAAPGAGTKKLSQAQLEANYIAGVLTLEQVNAGYQALGYGVTDRQILQQALLIKAANKAASSDTGDTVTLP